jgi:hypothetical protein
MATTEAVTPPIGPKAGANEVERTSQDLEKHHPLESDRIDKELAQYVGSGRVEITPERSRELRRKIDKRVLIVMIATYFLQAIDKGTMSFTSIMGLLDDVGMANANGGPNYQVCVPRARAFLDDC